MLRFGPFSAFSGKIWPKFGHRFVLPLKFILGPFLLCGLRIGHLGTLPPGRTADGPQRVCTLWTREKRRAYDGTEFLRIRGTYKFPELVFAFQVYGFRQYCGSVTFWYRYGSGSYRQWPSTWQIKIVFLTKWVCLLLITSFSKGKKS